MNSSLQNFCAIVRSSSQPSVPWSKIFDAVAGPVALHPANRLAIVAKLHEK